MLLRAVESGEVTPVGAHTTTKISVRIVAASAIDLRAAVAEGKFRSDLYYRLAQAEVQVPALRERKEELPWLMQYALSGQPVSLHVSAVEAALVRPWPGNVRELLSATRQAGTEALAEAPKDGVRLREKHLHPDAGRAVAKVPGAKGRGLSIEEVVDALKKKGPDEGWVPPAPPAAARPNVPTKEQVLEALKASQRNISAACRLLNIPAHNRTQLYRLMKEYGIPRDEENP